MGRNFNFKMNCLLFLCALALFFALAVAHLDNSNKITSDESERESQRSRRQNTAALESAALDAILATRGAGQGANADVSNVINRFSRRFAEHGSTDDDDDSSSSSSSSSSDDDDDGDSSSDDDDDDDSSSSSDDDDDSSSSSDDDDDS